jgi:hypothetical protein
MSNINSFPIPTTPFNASTLGVLEVANNLSDVADAAAARDNLGLYYESINAFETAIDAGKTYANGETIGVGVFNNRSATYLRNTSAINNGFSFAPGYEPADTVDVTLFGAVGDDDPSKATANTAAIQEAINYAQSHEFGRRKIVVIPEGYFRVNGTLRLTRSGMTLAGAGKGARLRRSDDYGDTIHWETNQAPDPITGQTLRLSDVAIWDIYCDQLADMTQGAHIRLGHIIRCETRGLQLWNGFGGIRADGLIKWNDIASTISSGAFWFEGVEADTFRAGSYFVSIDAPPGPLPVGGSEPKSSEISFTNPNWCRTGTRTGVPKVEHGLWFRNGDGVWTTGGHIFGAKNIITHSPSNADRICVGLRMIGTWLDQWSNRHYSAEGGGGAGMFGEVALIGCKGLNAQGTSVHVGTECTNYRSLEVIGGRYSIANAGRDIVDIGAGTHFTIGADFLSQQGMSSEARGIRIRDAARNVVIKPGTKVGTTVPSNPFGKGIVIDTVNPNVTVGEVSFYNVTQEFDVPNPVPDTSTIAIANTTKGASSVELQPRDDDNDSINLPFLASFFDITGTSGNITDILGAVEGRSVELRASSSGPYTFIHNTGAAGSRVRTPWGGPLVLRDGESVSARYSARAQAWILAPRDIVASGSVDNGSFVEYADGRLVCQHVLSTSASADVTWTFPRGFITATGLTVVVTPRTSATVGKIVMSRVPGTTSVAIAGYEADGTTRAAISCSLVASGRWRT